ncbi:MAG: hypothetical protein IJR04_02350 [Bacteroidales bacterium]|nr:hypothetical protein [Bacteroidales bacterium]
MTRSDAARGEDKARSGALNPPSPLCKGGGPTGRGAKRRQERKAGYS